MRVQMKMLLLPVLAMWLSVCAGRSFVDDSIVFQADQAVRPPSNTTRPHVGHHDTHAASSTTARPHVRPAAHRPGSTTRRPGSSTSATHVMSVTAPAKPSFTVNETECFVQNKVLYPATGQCYKLREKGPCANDSQWLVLDVDEAVRAGGTLRPVCKACPCCDKPQRVFWPQDGQCHKLSEKLTLCPFSGTELRSDPFGDGECGCTKVPPHVRHEPDVQNMTGYAGGCYPLYRRGPCDSRHVLTPVVLRGSGNVGRCTMDPCHSENERHPNVTYAAHAKDGRCHALGTQGPCATSEEKFGVHPITHQPQCIQPVNNIFKLPERCQTDMSGDCQKEINLSEDDKTIFALELLMSAEKRKKRRSRNSL